MERVLCNKSSPMITNEIFRHCFVTKGYVLIGMIYTVVLATHS